MIQHLLAELLHPKPCDVGTAELWLQTGLGLNLRAVCNCGSASQHICFLIHSLEICSVENNTGLPWVIVRVQGASKRRKCRDQGQAAPTCATLACRDVGAENVQSPSDSERNFDLLIRLLPAEYKEFRWRTCFRKTAVTIVNYLII